MKKRLLFALPCLMASLTASAQTSGTPYGSAIPQIQAANPTDEVLVFRPGLVTATPTNPGGYGLMRLVGPQKIAGVYRGAFAASVAYQANDMVSLAGSFYAANAAFTSTGTFNSANWTAVITPGTTFTLTAATTSALGGVKAGQNLNIASDGTASVSGVVRGVFAASTAYAANDMILQGGLLYTANVAFTSGSTFSGSNWTAVTSAGLAIGTVSGTAADAATVLLKANNLSDVTAATARTNLGLGGAATENVGTATGTVADGGVLNTLGTTVAAYSDGAGNFLATKLGNILSAAYHLTGVPFTRTLAQRLTDEVDAQDYAAGDGDTTTLSTALGSGNVTSLAALAAYTTGWGTTPFSFVTNSNFGMTFPMTTTAAQGAASTTLTFVDSLTGINGWAGTAPQWDNPAHGNDLLDVGMLVSSTSSGCTIPAGTTVTAFDNNVANVASTMGTVTLSAATTTACPSGSVITFTMPPAAIAAMTYQTLGLYAAMNAAATLAAGNENGALLRIPAGTYETSRDIINVANTTDYTGQAGLVRIEGAGSAETRIMPTFDFGENRYALRPLNASGVAPSSLAVYKGLFFRNAFNENTTIYGSMPVAQSTSLPVQMGGLLLTEKEKVYDISASGFHAGVTGINDHWEIHDSNISNNGYNVYFGKYSPVMGDQKFFAVNLDGATVASIGVASTDQADNTDWFGGHTGSAPYSWFKESKEANVTTGLLFVTNSSMIHQSIEADGLSYMYGADAGAVVQGNKFQDMGFGSVSATFTPPSGTPTASFYVDGFNSNVFDNATMLALPSTYTAVIQTNGIAGGGISNNSFRDSPTMISVPTAAIPLLSIVNGGVTGNAYSNTFASPLMSGRLAQAVGAITALMPVGLNGNSVPYVTTYADGGSYVGVAYKSASAQHNIIPVVERAFLQGGLSVVKADPTQACATGGTVFPTSAGFKCGIDSFGAVGALGSAATSGGTTLQVDFAPSYANGVRKVATAQTAATAQTLTSTIAIYTTSGSATQTLPAIPTGESVRIVNQTASAITVAPGAFNGTTGSITPPTGTSATTDTVPANTNYEYTAIGNQAFVR
jgi:hypothetical protein